MINWNISCQYGIQSCNKVSRIIRSKQRKENNYLIFFFLFSKSLLEGQLQFFLFGQEEIKLWNDDDDDDDDLIVKYQSIALTATPITQSILLQTKRVEISQLINSANHICPSQIAYNVCFSIIQLLSYQPARSIVPGKYANLQIWNHTNTTIWCFIVDNKEFLWTLQKVFICKEKEEIC